MSVLAAAVAIWMGGGLLAFSAWAVRQFATRELARDADWTTILIYRTGQALIWLAAVVMVGLFLGASARVAWLAVAA